jgi:hypothetical protein
MWLIDMKGAKFQVGLASVNNQKVNIYKDIKVSVQLKTLELS